jgi:1-acyl-sn-glycerol-3-phosphate acyltransferase
MNVRFLAGPIAAIARFIAGVRVTWVGEPPPEGAQSIFFANHSSTLDGFVLWASLPGRLRALARPVAAKDYWDKGWRRVLAVDVFNAILVPRHEHEGRGAGPAAAQQTIERIAAEMGDRSSLIIFPEGTRGEGTEIQPFKSGLYYLCRAKPGIRLVPACIENLNRVLPKGEALPVPFISRITFGPPLYLQAEEPKERFLTRARDALLELGTGTE